MSAVHSPQSTVLSPEEEADLRALGSELAGALQSPWEPRCVAGTFATPTAATPILFTMQAWIELESIRSPLLQGELPATPAEVAAAAQFFALPTDELDGEEAGCVASKIRRAMADGFGMALPMKQPGAERSRGDGFGSWLPTFTFLLTECHLSLAEARALPVGQAFALIAARRRNQGWEPMAASYAERDVDCRATAPVASDPAGGAPARQN